MKLFGPSLHQINGKSFSLELQIECMNSAGNHIVVMILFKTEDEGKTTSHFLKELGLGKGNIKKMKLNKKKVIKFKHDHALINLVDHFFYVHYKGSSIFQDSCDNIGDIDYFLITETIKISQ